MAAMVLAAALASSPVVLAPRGPSAESTASAPLTSSATAPASVASPPSTVSPAAAGMDCTLRARAVT